MSSGSKFAPPHLTLHLVDSKMESSRHYWRPHWASAGTHKQQETDFWFTFGFVKVTSSRGLQRPGAREGGAWHPLLQNRWVAGVWSLRTRELACLGLHHIRLNTFNNPYKYPVMWTGQFWTQNGSWSQAWTVCAELANLHVSWILFLCCLFGSATTQYKLILESVCY